MRPFLCRLALATFAMALFGITVYLALGCPFDHLQINAIELIFEIPDHPQPESASASQLRTFGSSS